MAKSGHATAIVSALARVQDMRNETTAAPSREELEILDLLARGYTDDVVAARLGLARRTYRRRLRLVMDRLGAQSRFQAGVHAAQRGWIGSAGGSLGHDRDEDQGGRRRTLDEAKGRSNR